MKIFKTSHIITFFFAILLLSSCVSMKNFTDLQKQIIEREFKFQLNIADVDIESFDIEDNYFTILLLFPFETDVRAILQAVIEECNQYGNFLDNKFLFTNVKVFTEAEIQKEIEKKKE